MAYQGYGDQQGFGSQQSYGVQKGLGGGYGGQQGLGGGQKGYGGQQGLGLSGGQQGFGGQQGLGGGQQQGLAGQGQQWGRIGAEYGERQIAPAFVQAQYSASVSPQHPKREIPYTNEENEMSDYFSTPVKRERRSINYINQTPTKLHAHPPGWERITQATKVYRRAFKRMDFDEIATAAH
uniref:Uncharacterized protein n=1 Tax=Panagrolaimus sp. PS1159 TaxID=55785 RepID=A0AC35G0R8_9BILA